MNMYNIKHGVRVTSYILLPGTKIESFTAQCVCCTHVFYCICICVDSGVYVSAGVKSIPRCTHVCNVHNTIRQQRYSLDVKIQHYMIIYVYLACERVCTFLLFGNDGRLLLTVSSYDGYFFANTCKFNVYTRMYVLYIRFLSYSHNTSPCICPMDYRSSVSPSASSKPSLSLTFSSSPYIYTIHAPCIYYTQTYNQSHIDIYFYMKCICAICISARKNAIERD